TSAQPATRSSRKDFLGTSTGLTLISARVHALNPKVAASSTKAQPAPTVKISTPASAGPARLVALRAMPMRALPAWRPSSPGGGAATPGAPVAPPVAGGGGRRAARGGGGRREAQRGGAGFRGARRGAAAGRARVGHSPADGQQRHLRQQRAHQHDGEAG